MVESGQQQNSREVQFYGRFAPPDPQYPNTTQGLIFCISKIYSLLTNLLCCMSSPFDELIYTETIHMVFVDAASLIREIDQLYKNLDAIHLALKNGSGDKFDPNLSTDLSRTVGQMKRVFGRFTLSALDDGLIEELQDGLQKCRNHFSDTEWEAAWRRAGE